MKSIDVIYKFGHIYDRKSKERLIFNEGSEFIIIINEENLKEKDNSTQVFSKSLNSVEKIKSLNKSYKNTTPYWLILNKDSDLYFKLSGFDVNGKNISLDFRLKLLEDLYIYKKSKHARLTSCKCKIIECSTKGFEYFEPVYGNSLNKARTKLYELLFSRNSNPASNAFDQFYTNKSYKKIYSLNSIRERIEQQDEIPSNWIYHLTDTSITAKVHNTNIDALDVIFSWHELKDFAELRQVFTGLTKQQILACLAGEKKILTGEP